MSRVTPPPGLTLLYDRAQIQKRVHELASSIRRDYAQRNGHDIVVVCVLKGAVVFLADLIREIGLDFRLSFVSVSSYGSQTESMGVPIIRDVSVPDIAGADVLIVEDILDTGLSMKALIDKLRARAPRSVRLCVLIDKCERRSVSVTAEYVGFELREGFVVGYGIDHAERYRHLPDVFTIDKRGSS
jgi:hypoxanthine phosphoribosyltransferase